MSPFFSILVVRVPFHAPVRGGSITLSEEAKHSMSDQLRDRPQTIKVRESPPDAPHPADGISSYDDHALEHTRRSAAVSMALVVRIDQMLELCFSRFLPCHELERVR